MKLSLTLFLLGSACYLALLWGFRLQIFHRLYAGKYTGYAGWPLLLLGLVPLVQSVPNVLGNALGALERSDLGFGCCVGGAVAALAVGVPLVSRLGVGGALVGLVASNVLMGVLTFFFLERSVRRDECLALI